MAAPHRPDPRGVALCLASAVGFGAIAIFAKEAYAGGAGIPTLLTMRFGGAAVLLWVLVARRGGGAPAGGSPAPGLALGVLYAVEACAFFLALSRIDAALAELLLYAYPALVVVAAAAMGRERLTRGRVLALGLATAGTALVLAAGDMARIDALGVGAALASAVLYAGYTLVSDRVVEGRDPLLVAAQVTTSAGVLFLVGGLAAGAIDLDLTARAWVAIAAMTVLSTVVPIVAFLRGMQLVGVGTAAITSCVEPVVTVGLAMLVLGERLAPVQLAGGALVVGALVLLARGAGSVGAHEPAPVAAGPAPARPVREHAAVG